MRIFAYPFHTVLGIVFLMLNCAFLPSIPGFMGDESHEGENVYHIIADQKIAVIGERSYIGPMIDYIRIPFVLLLGYTPIAMRSVMVVTSLLFYAISAYLLVRYVGNQESIIPLLLLTFSPIYITQQRLSWAITLIPLFAVLLIFALTSSWKQKYLLAGLIAGLGLANHLIFLPTLTAIIIAFVLFFVMPDLFGYLRRRRIDSRLRGNDLLLPLIIGFMAGFAMQFAILQLYPDDQGSQTAIAETFMTRITALPSLLPELISGSSYIASYTGVELSPIVMNVIAIILALFATVALAIPKHRKVSWIICIALLIHLFVLLRIVDRYSLRYFTTFILGVWLLSGIGIEGLVGYIRKKIPSIAYMATSAITLLLIMWSVFGIFVPYIKTGGSTAVFALGNRTDSASALVDTTELLSCVRGLGPVTSESVHIYNRLEFWSRQYKDVVFVDEDHKKQATYTVDYRVSENQKLDVSGTICPQMKHFRISNKK